MIKVGGKDMLVVESHAHVWEEFKGQRFGDCSLIPVSYGKVTQGNEVIQLLPPEYADLSVKLEILMGYMDYCGVDKAVILQNPCYGDQREYVRDIVRKYPGKFVGIGMIDPRDKENVGKEIDILIKEFDCKGVKMEIPDVPFIMDDPEYDFMWEKIIENDAIAAIDLGWGDGPYDFNIDRLRNVMNKYPNMKTVLCHLGVSRLWDLNQKYPFEKLQQTLSLLDINKDNLWFDLSGITFYDYHDEYPFPRGQSILKAVKESVGMDRIMWGSDFPTAIKISTYKQCLDIVVKHCDFLTEKELEMVLGLNAMKIYFK